ncbi:MAG: acyl--CoA ligase [Oscillospiraceae bacterium]|nr:acyl--CoA ligase [Oscillospiraceae bacterium]MBQ7130651.1 acyl--CoA ligase [Oscillospiraceae bacterium]
MTILKTIKQAIAGREDQIGFSYGLGRRYAEKTWGEFYRDVCALIPFYKGCGHKFVGIMTANGYLLMVHSYAAISAGCAAAVVDPVLYTPDVSAMLDNADTQLLLVDGDLTDVVEEMRELSPGRQVMLFPEPGERMDEEASEEGMHICFTSGTSHLSKPVLISQQALIETAASFERALNGTAGDDTYLPLSASHIFAYTTTLALLMRGAKICYGRGIRYTEKDLAYYHPGLVVTVPGHMRSILEAKAIARYPKYFAVGGSLCTQENFERAAAAGITVQVVYGTTETIGPATISDRDGSSRGMRCMDDKQMHLTEDREILIAGDLMEGYYRREEATAEVLKDGWYHTGDIGYLDEENRLFIEGRIRDIIVTENGEKINCNEVDEKLYGMPGSLELAVFEVEGRMLAAVVPENETVTQAQLEREIGRYNATQPFSRRVVQVWRREEKLPRTLVGKLKRAALTKEWMERFENTQQ